jgi:hypothetical protein
MSESQEQRKAAWGKVAEAAFLRMDRPEAEMLKQTFSEIEAIVLEETRKLGVQLLLTRLEMDPRSGSDGEFLCTGCQKPLRIQEPQQVRRLETVIGEVEYRRPYGVCDRCGISYAPLDGGLGIPVSGGSVGRLEQICHAAVTGRSFEAAAEILREHDRIELSAKQVRILSETEGGRVVKERNAEVEAFRKRDLSFGGPEAVELIVVTADGGRVQTRQSHNQSAWKEDRVGGVYDAIPKKDPAADSADHYKGAEARMKTYVASLSTWEEFGWMLCVEAMRRGYEHARQKLFLSDGAVALRTLRQMHFPDAVFILDWYHATEHLADAAKAAWGEGSDAYRTGYETLKDQLWQGDVEAILAWLRKESARVGPPEPKEADSSPRVVLYRNQGYFGDNREGMNYPKFRTQGWPIGSGIAESAVKQFGMRLKGTEKFWNGFGFGLGADEMLALCALHISEDNRWREHWDRRSRPYVRTPK